MGVPKRKTSKQRIRSRKASHKVTVLRGQSCPECGATQLPHRICPACGKYRGRQMLTIEAD